MFKIGIIESSSSFLPNLLLDSYPGASAAFSLRKLRNNYTGSAVRVRRSQDSQESDIGFAYGVINEAQMASFAGNANGFKYSEDFTNAAWTKTRITLTANATTDPNGGSTATLATESTASSGEHFISGTTTPDARVINGLTYTISVYAKKGPGANAPDIIQIVDPAATVGSTSRANFNINTGTVTAVGGGTANIQSAGNGWWRCSYTFTSSQTTGNALTGYPIVFCNNESTRTALFQYLAASNSNVYIWGAQINAGSSPTTYQQTTANDSGTLSIVKWYDQSGNARDLAQSSTSFQPIIYNAGATVLDGGKPTVMYNSDILTIPTSTSLFNTIHNGSRAALVMVSKTSSSGVVLASNAYLTTQVGFQFAPNSLYVYRGVSSTNVVSIASGIPNSARYLYYIDFDTSNATANQRAVVYANATQYNLNAATGTPSTANASLNLSLGGIEGVSYQTGFFQEFVLYPDNQSSNSSGIRSNVNGYYAIY